MKELSIKMEIQEKYKMCELLYLPCNLDLSKNFAKQTVKFGYFISLSLCHSIEVLTELLV